MKLASRVEGAAYRITHFLGKKYCLLFERGGIHVTLQQGFSTPGPRTGAGPWLNQYRAAQELISYFCFIYYLSLGQ